MEKILKITRINALNTGKFVTHGEPTGVRKATSSSASLRTRDKLSLVLAKSNHMFNTQSLTNEHFNLKLNIN